MKRMISICILVFLFLVFIIGCSQKIQPKAWLSVEKSPMRVIIFDSEKDVDPKVVKMVIDSLVDIPYNDYVFNDETRIGVDTKVDYKKDFVDTINRSIRIKR